MKFNFEKAKKVGKTGLVYGGAVVRSLLTPVGSEGQEPMDNTPIDTNNQSIVANLPYKNFELKDSPQTITFNQATELYQDTLEKKNEALLENIDKMEDEFNILHSQKFEINPNSITILAGSQVGNLKDPNFLNDRYVSDEILTSLLDSMPNVKILARDLSILNAVNSENNLHERGLIGEHNDYKYSKPEKYFVINQEKSNDSVFFSLQIVSSLDNSVQNVDLGEYIITDDNSKNEEIFSQKIIPDLTSKIQTKIQELGLDNSNE